MSAPHPGDVARALSFFASLGLHLRRLPTLDQARTTLRQRFAERETGWLALVRRGVYGNPRSPYRRLLRHAGCEFGDLQHLVRQNGLEGALHALYRRGVYLTAAEFKGEQPLVRGSLRLQAGFAAVRVPWRLTPSPVRGLPAGPGGLVPLHLALFRDLAVTAGLSLDARGGTHWAHGHWGWPLAISIIWLLRHSGPDWQPARWFSRVPLGSGLRSDMRWTAWLAALVSRLAGRPFPPLAFVSLDDPAPILAWMQAELRAGRTPHLITIPSIAISTAQLALEQGLGLRGAQFTIGGEPLTAGRLDLFRRTGAAVVPTYGAKESGTLAYGCLAPQAPDDMHLYDDQFGLIQPGPDSAAADLPPDSLLVTVLRASWPLLLLNVSLGDRANLLQRACGCPLERLGWTTHLHTIRGFDKFNIGGSPVLAADIVRLLEQELPARFGGGPTDYQLVEEDEVVDGQARLRLLVHPQVGPLDETALRTRLLDVMSGNGLPLGSMWREPRWLTVERRPPLITAGGKQYHIHQTSWPAARPPGT